MRNIRTVTLGIVAVVATSFLFAVSIVSAADTVPKPKEFGVYAKTGRGLHRILPNIVSDEDGVFYVEPNNPQRFPLGSVDYFVINGNYTMDFITLNPMKPFRLSALGTPRMMFGKDVEISITKKGDALYAVKPKGLFGRGYYAIWINDTAWDFIIE
jgi:hypothetical protein